MENDRQREALQAQIDAMLAQAYVTEDGTRAFRTEDGTQVFNEHGNDITEHVNPAIIGDTGPSWEDFNTLKQEQAALEAERTAILDYQQRLDEAREAVASGTMTEAELDEFETELRETMPEAVRAQLPGDHPAAAVEQTAEVEPSREMPSLDGLGGFSMPTMGG